VYGRRGADIEVWQMVASQITVAHESQDPLTIKGSPRQLSRPTADRFPTEVFPSTWLAVATGRMQEALYCRSFASESSPSLFRAALRDVVIALKRAARTQSPARRDAAPATGPYIGRKSAGGSAPNCERGAGSRRPHSSM
jgi:hypothetical protein